MGEREGETNPQRVKTQTIRGGNATPKPKKLKL